MGGGARGTRRGRRAGRLAVSRTGRARRTRVLFSSTSRLVMHPGRDYNLRRPHCATRILSSARVNMYEIDQRDRELLTALQGEIPLVSTPFAFIGQSIDMSEKEVIKRTERLRREGVIRSFCGHFDPR